MIRSQNSATAERNSLKIELRLVSKKNKILDEEEAWNALIDCFKNHPTLEVYQALVSPDKEGKELHG